MLASTGQNRIYSLSFVDVDKVEGQKMDYKALLFSPRGRINRKRYWLTILAADLVFMAFYIPVSLAIQQNEDVGLIKIVLLVAVLILSLVFSYVGIVLGIKRFHDRDKSGWWMLISLVPAIGGIWFFIECGFLRGTVGRNRFGADPLAPNDDIVRIFGAPEQQTIR